MNNHQSIPTWTRYDDWLDMWRRLGKLILLRALADNQGVDYWRDEAW